MKRSVLSLIYLLQGMRKIDMQIDDRLQHVGIQIDAIDPSAVIHPSLEHDILQHAVTDLAPIMGLKIGQHYALMGYGPLLMLLVTSPTVHEALTQVLRFQDLTHLTGKLSVHTQGERVGLCYLPHNLNDDVNRLVALAEISGTYKFIRDIYKMMGLSEPDIQLTLPMNLPRDADELSMYQRYYGEHVQFDADQAIFLLDQAVLELKIPSADQATFDRYEEKCLHELNRLHADDELPILVQRVQGYLALQVGTMPTMAETAVALNIPERTLRHQLQQFETSYKQIREKIIQDKALHLIEYKEYTLEMIAELLGYSEPAAFNHAFKRWFGLSPRQYLK